MTKTATPSRASRTQTAIKIGLAGATWLAFTACSSISDRITEEGAERIIENQTGDDVELDFDTDDGGVSIQTEDGDISIDQNNGQFTIEDGESVFEITEELPSQWPADVPRPEGLDVDSGSYISTEGTVQMMVGGETAGSAIDYVDTYSAALAGAGFAETSDFFASDDFATTSLFTFERGDWEMTVSGTIEGNSNTVQVIITTPST